MARVRWVVAMVAVAAGALGLSAQALAAAAPSPYPAGPTPALHFARAERRCPTSAVDLSLGPAGTERGHGYAVFDLLNASPSTCNLDGFPTVRVRRTGGHAVDLRARDSRRRGLVSPYVRRQLVHLRPGDEVDFWLEWAERSGRRAGFVSVVPPGAERAITVRNHLVEVGAGRLTVSPVTSAVLER